MSDSLNAPPPEHRPFLELTWDDIKGRARELITFLPQFLRHPVQGVRKVPSWDWPTVLLLEILLSAATSMATGVVARHILAVIGGLVVGPVMGLVVSFVIAGIMYYATLFFLKTELEFRRVFIVVVLAKVLGQIVGILSPLSRPISLITIFLTAYFLTEGMAENFLLEKKKISRIVGTLAGFVILLWLYSVVTDVTTNRIKVQDYTPESLDQIHKELNDAK